MISLFHILQGYHSARERRWLRTNAAGSASLKPVVPVFFAYLLSFVVLGIYWNNHHHMFQATDEVGGAVLWANLHLLFWLSLIPFVTAWMGENHFASLPTCAYGVVLFTGGSPM